jgi:ankyrin repeat protein
MGNKNMNIIMMASWFNKIELLKLVLSKYTAIVSKIIDDCAYDGLTAIKIASIRGYYEVVELLLSYNANVNIQSNGIDTALHNASYFGDTRIVELLLTKGALVNIQNSKYSNYRNTSIVKLILSKGAHG